MQCFQSMSWFGRIPRSGESLAWRFCRFVDLGIWDCLGFWDLEFGMPCRTIVRFGSQNISRVLLNSVERLWRESEFSTWDLALKFENSNSQLFVAVCGHVRSANPHAEFHARFSLFVFHGFLLLPDDHVQPAILHALSHHPMPSTNCVLVYLFVNAL